jgi:hypothetical protein
VDEGDIGQPRAAESGPQLEPLLKCLLVFVTRHVFDDDGVITFADFAALVGLAFPLLWDIYKLGRQRWLRDKLHNIILQHTACVSMTTTIQLVLAARVWLLTLFGG